MSEQDDSTIEPDDAVTDPDDDVQQLLGPCMAAIQRGEDRLFVSLYDADEKPGKGKGKAPDFDDDLTF